MVSKSRRIAEGSNTEGISGGIECSKGTKNPRGIEWQRE